MKIIGSFPRAKGWVVHFNAKTKQVYGDYNEPVGLSPEQVNRRTADARALIAANPERPADPPAHPGWSYNEHDPESVKAWKAKVEAYNYARNLQQMWDKANVEQHWRYFEFAPVFRGVGVFIGYTRGRSSVTMQFKFETGCILEIGPSGIDKFIQGVQDGHIMRKDGGFDLTFRMEKKGANVYMWPMFETADFEGMKSHEAVIA